MSNRRPLAVVLLILVALGAILVLSKPRSDPYLRKDLDPRGTGPAGLKAMTELARGQGADVRLDGLPTGDDDVVLQVRDRFGDRDTRALRRWVRDGGTLVVTDPTASLAPRAELVRLSTDQPGVCDVEALRGLRLDAGLPVAFLTGEGDQRCFGDGERSGVVVSRLGRGRVVAVSSIGPFLNRELAGRDDAAFVLTVLQARPGTTIRVLDPLRFRSGDEASDGSILGALPTRFREAIQLLIIAFLLWALAHGRRLGKPVPEVLPAPVPGSDLVLAVGEMMARNDQAQAAADRLRARSVRRTGSLLGLTPESSPDVVLATLDPLVSLDRPALQRALYGPVTTNADLVQVARLLDRLDEELHATATR